MLSFPIHNFIIMSVQQLLGNIQTKIVSSSSYEWLLFCYKFVICLKSHAMTKNEELYQKCLYVLVFIFVEQFNGWTVSKNIHISTYNSLLMRYEIIKILELHFNVIYYFFGPIDFLSIAFNLLFTVIYN